MCPLLLLIPAILFAQSLERTAVLGGSGIDTVRAIAADGEGNIYIAGSTASLDLPALNSHSERHFAISSDGVEWKALHQLPEGTPLALAAGPSAPATLLAASRDSIWKSQDGSQTWRRVHREDAGLYGNTFRTIAIDPGNPKVVLVAGSPGKMLRSEDGGESFAPVDARCDTPYARVWFDPRGSGTAACLQSITRDGGRTWSPLSRNALPPTVQSLAFDPHRPGRIYAADLGRLWVTTNWGADWSVRQHIGFFADDLLADPLREDRLFAATSQGVFRSDDGGLNWNHMVSLSPGTYPHLLRSCAGLYLYGIHLSDIQLFAQSMFRSTDDGNTWEPIPVLGMTGLTFGPGCTGFASKAVAPNALVAKFAPGGRELLWAAHMDFAGPWSDAVALASHPSGGVVVAGNVTRLTLAPFGPVRTTDVFAARLDSSGQLVYSKIFGGQGNDTAAALAVDAAGRAFLAGQTRSLDFLVTSNALQPQIRGAPFDGQIAPDGFLTQLDASGEILYSTCLGGTGEDTPSAIAIDRQGNAFVAGLTRSSDFPVTGDAMQPASAGAADAFLARIDPSASQLLYSTYIGGQGDDYATALALGESGNVHLSGSTYSPNFPLTIGTGDRLTSERCGAGNFRFSASDIFVIRFEGNLPVHSSLLGAYCVFPPTRIEVTAAGSLHFATRADFSGTFPLRAPFEWTPRCGGMVQLSAAGAEIEFGTYIDACSVATAQVSDGRIVVASNLTAERDIALDVIEVPPPRTPAIDRIANAFSGSGVAVSRGLVSLTGLGLGPEDPVSAGLDNPSPPAELGGTRVWFNGLPAPIVIAGARQVICAAPDLDAHGVRVSVEVEYAGRRLPAAVMPAGENLGLLTRAFPDVGPEANARNEDGSENSSENPAAPGSTITLYATGFRPGSPSISVSWDPQLVTPTRIPGFVPGFYEIQTRVPAGLPPGAYPITLMTTAGFRRFAAGNAVYAYVR